MQAASTIAVALNGTAGRNGTAGHNGHAGHDGTPPLPPVKTAEPPLSGQDPRTGRFTPGNKCAKGNPHFRRAAALRSAFAAAVSEDEIRQLARSLLAQALAGDTTAAGLFLAYAVGKPRPAPDPDEADQHEWQLIRGRPSDAEVLLHLLESAPPGPAAEAIRQIDGGLQDPARVLGTVADRLRKGGGQNVAAERVAKCRRRK
jgi:hypothetical protein